MLLETHGGIGLSDRRGTLKDYVGTPEECGRDPQKGIKAACMESHSCPRTVYTPWLISLTLTLDNVFSPLEKGSYARNRCPNAPKVPSSTAEY